MNTYKNALNLIDKFFNERSKDEIEAIINKIGQLQIEGPTYEEYLDSIETSFYFGLNIPCNGESWNSFLLNPENIVAGTTQRKSITISETPELVFKGIAVTGAYSGEYNFGLAA